MVGDHDFRALGSARRFCHMTAAPSIYPPIVMRLAAIAWLSLAACVPHASSPNATPRIVTLRGTVLDSLAHGPLRDARVALSGPDTLTVNTGNVFDSALALR